jgi:hypothetical protein
MKYTTHFLRDVLPKRPYLTEELLLEIVLNPLKKEIQSNGWIKIWGYSSKYKKYIRVVLLEDFETVHTAFFDRNFREGN